MRLGREPPGGSAARLRTLTRVAGVWAGVLVLIACIALAVLTTVSRGYSQKVLAMNRSLRAVDQVRMDLAAYLREGALEYATQHPQYESDRLRLEETLLADSAGALRLATDSRQRATLDEADRRIREYLVLARGVDRRAGLTRPLIVGADAARQQLHEASRMGFDAVARAEHKLARWGLLESILGVSLAALVLASFGIVVVSLRRLVLAPLLALGDGIDQFAAGDTSARVVPTGPDTVRHTAESFNEMAARLQQQRQDLLTFLAGVAHDLRNPLAAMRMGVALVQPGPRRASQENEHKTLELIGRQVTRLERMVGDFLDASRIEAGHLELRREPTDARELTQETARLYADSSIRHHVVVSLPDHAVELNIDGTRIAQVLNNLVSNAIKYSPAGGDVQLSLTAQGGEAVFSVQDSGIGIAPSDLPHIFEPFRRTGASKETAPGVGLGLSVARRIIEHHGGRIEVESTCGVGSIFRVHLPLESGAPAFAPAAVH
jgi:signal transduction histidine kinase